MLVGVASLPPSFPSSRTQALYILKRQNCLNICNRVYFLFFTFSIKPIKHCFEMGLLELSEVFLLHFTGAQRFSSTSIKIDDCFLFQSFSIRFWGEFVLSKKSYKNPEERSIQMVLRMQESICALFTSRISTQLYYHLDNQL